MSLIRKNCLMILTGMTISMLAFAAPAQHGDKAPLRGFQTLAGCIPAEIQELTEYFKESAATRGESNRVPKGILLVGQSGIGKTSMAKALSEEVICPFIYKRASDLNDKDSVRKIFQDARSKAASSMCNKAILFIDDFDSFGTNKELGGSSVANETRENVLALMNEMDGFEQDDSILVIAATHCADNFDRSLIRSGRFDKVIEMELPTVEQRIAILKKYNQGSDILFDRNLDLRAVMSLSYNLTPADLKQLLNKSYLAAKAEKSRTLLQKHILIGLLKVIQAKSRTDKALNVRLKVISDLLNNKKDQKKGYARLVGSVPDDIQDLVDQIKNDASYKQFNLNLPKGILLTGPPGTGKTSLVRAVSEEAGCEFMAVSGAEFVQSLVGEGAQKIRDLFKEARQKAVTSESKKTIIFIDEIDAIGKRQGNSLDSTITQLLTEMDGFDEDNSIVVIAASNNPNNLDAALLRPGRFSKIIEVGLPDLAKRELILKHYTQGIPLFADVDLKKVAQATNNFSPADLKELLQEAGSAAKREKLSQIKQKHFLSGIKTMLTARILKGEKDVRQQIDALDVIFNGKESVSGFKRLVGGVEPAIVDLVKMMRGEVDYARFGVPFPKGILLAGPPGTGKTALVRALAEEAGCEFIQAKGSEFIEKYVGVGAQRVRDLFADARKKAKGNQHGKTIIFVDEIDAIGSRGTADNSETQQTVTEFLTQMDGFYKDDSVIVIAATNAPSSLDPALLRAGRFDSIIEVGLPNLEKRIALFEYYAKGRPVDTSVLFNNLALAMDGCNAADIKNLIDKAATLAMREKSATISQRHFDQAIAAIKAAEMQKNASYVSIG